MKAWVKGIIAGAVITAVGVVVLIVGLWLNNWNYAFGYADFETWTYTAEQDNASINAEINTSRVKTEFYDGEKIEIEYPFSGKYPSEIFEESGTLHFKGFKLKWYNFGWTNKKIPYTVIKLPKSGVFNLKIELNAGTVNIADGEYGDINIEVNAGTLSMSAVECNNFKCEVNAGAVNIDGLNCGIATCEVSAGSCNIKNLVSPAIYADVSAGALNIAIDGKKSDYNITANKSAGSCSVTSQHGNTDKKLIVEVSAGAADISFSDN